MKKDVSNYIASAPRESQEKLAELRRLIRKVAPEASEKISYGMPGYKINGKPLIYFAGYKDHIGIYPTADKLPAELKELEKFRTGKGTLWFPIDKDLPLDLIRKMIKFRLESI